MHFILQRAPQVNMAVISPGERGHVLSFSQQKESVKNAYNYLFVYWHCLAE